MKRIVIFALAALCALANVNAQSQIENGKILVAYFSHSGNTRAVADQIHKTAGGDIFEIKTVTPYPSGYNDVLAQARQEIDADFRPPLSVAVPNMASYDTVFVGYPIWYGTTPPPIVSFLTWYDFSGKTVIPFSTSGSSSGAPSFQKIKTLCPQSTVLDGLHFTSSTIGGAPNAVSAWLRRIGIVN